MKRILSVGVLAAILFAQKPVPPAVEEQLPKPPPEQPIPFNHKTHVAAGVKCLDCHPIRGDGFQAGFPREAACMGCHVSIKSDSPHIKKIQEAMKSKTPIRWARIYQVPDYVWFSHASHHTDKKTECATCHGPVSEREVLFKEKPTNMYSCMDCHAKTGAPNGCDFCHNTQ